MKKTFLMILLAASAIFVTSCGGDEAKQYKGNYKGTFTFIKEDGRTKAGTVHIGVNPAKENSLLFWDVLNMDNTGKTGVYESTTEELTIITNILGAMGVNIGSDQKIKDMHITATFSDYHLSMRVEYSIEIVAGTGIEVTIPVIQFEGDKS